MRNIICIRLFNINATRSDFDWAARLVPEDASWADLFFKHDRFPSSTTVQ